MRERTFDQLTETQAMPLQDNVFAHDFRVTRDDSIISLDGRVITSASYSPERWKEILDAVDAHLMYDCMNQNGDDLYAQELLAENDKLIPLELLPQDHQ